jgi:hypothetical protein
MNTQAGLFESSSPVEVPDERARAHEMDLTPAPLVRQMLESLAPWCNSEGLGSDGHPIHVEDPCAGAGVFGQELRRTWPHAHTRGIELREEEREGLESNYDECAIGSFLDCASDRVDVVVTNPAFSLAEQIVRHYIDRLTPSGVICILQLGDFGQRSKAGAKLFADFPPRMQLRIMGSVKFRNGVNPETGKVYTSDLRSYSWWVFGAQSQRQNRCWGGRNLDRLPACDRRWEARPGDEWRLFDGDAVCAEQLG